MLTNTAITQQQLFNIQLPKTQKNILCKSSHNKQQAKKEMDGYRFFSRNIFKEKKPKQNKKRNETKQTQHNRLHNVPLISPIQIIPEKHSKERTINWKSPVTRARESMLKRNGHDKCCKRQMVTEGHRQKESRPQIRNMFTAVCTKPLEGFSFKKGFNTTCN